MVTIAVPAEEDETEPRIALSPDTAKKFISHGCQVRVQSGAGRGSHFADAEFEAVGVEIAKSPADTIKDADVILTVRTN